MKKRIIFSALMVLVVCLLMGGATFALFTDWASNSAVTLTAGRVDVDARRDLGDPVPGPMFYVERNVASGFPVNSHNPGHPTGLWWPGRQEIRQLDVFNTGTLDSRIKGFSASMTGIADPSKAAKFADALNVEISVSNNQQATLFSGTLAQLLSGEQPVVPALLNATYASPGSFVHLSYKVTLDLNRADNDLQGVNPVVNFDLYVEQAQ